MQKEMREQIKKDLDPHKPYRMDMWHGVLIMHLLEKGAWDIGKVSAIAQKNTARRSVEEIVASRDED